MIICHFATDPESLAKVRNEFNKHLSDELKSKGLEEPESKKEMLK